MGRMTLFLISLSLVVPMGAVQAGTVGEWNFRNMSGSLSENDRIRDLSGNGRDLRVSASDAVGTPSITQAGPLAGQTAISFSGNGGGEMLVFEPGFNGFNDGGPAAGTDFDIGNPGGIYGSDYDGSGAPCVTCVGESFTHEVIVKLPYVPFGGQSGPKEGGVFGKGGIGGGSDHWGLNMIGPLDSPPSENGGTKLEVVLSEWIEEPPHQTSFWRSMSFARGTVDAGWHHIAVTRNRNTDRQQVFVDGVEFGAENIPSRQLQPNNMPGANFVIGARDSNNNRAFRGSIAYVRISDEVLAPSQFAQVVPEPSALVLTILGLFGMVGYRRR